MSAVSKPSTSPNYAQMHRDFLQQIYMFKPTVAINADRMALLNAYPVGGKKERQLFTWVESFSNALVSSSVLFLSRNN